MYKTFPFDVDKTILCCVVKKVIPNISFFDYDVIKNRDENYDLYLLSLYNVDL
jgi:hypothetical protein